MKASYKIAFACAAVVCAMIIGYSIFGGGGDETADSQDPDSPAGQSADVNTSQDSSSQTRAQLPRNVTDLNPSNGPSGATDQTPVDQSASTDGDTSTLSARDQQGIAPAVTGGEADSLREILAQARRDAEQATGSLDGVGGTDGGTGGGTGGENGQSSTLAGSNPLDQPGADGTRPVADDTTGPGRVIRFDDDQPTDGGDDSIVSNPNDTEFNPTRIIRFDDDQPTVTGDETTTTTDADTTRTNPSQTYIVQEGDTLSGIATKLYGSERHWVDIAQANPLVDPVRLSIGQELRLPTREDLQQATAVPDAPENEVNYTVRSGDTLSSIARNYYGDPNAWQVIFNANRDKIGSDPDSLQAGMVLRIPPAITAAN